MIWLFIKSIVYVFFAILYLPIGALIHNRDYVPIVLKGFENMILKAHRRGQITNSEAQYLLDNLYYD